LKAPRARFRHGDALIDADRVVARPLAHEGEQLRPRFRLAAPFDQLVADDERARAGQRVARLAAGKLELNDRVGRRAGWFTADMVPERRLHVVKREGEAEDVGDALDREGLLAVAGDEAAFRP
jgi:hypothetical protein